MKAEYVKPNIHFEMFTANDAVAACLAHQGFHFECLSGENKDYSAVLNNSLNLLPNGDYDSCNVEAGVAWMNTVTTDQLKEIYDSDVNSKDYSIISNSTVTADGCNGTTSIGRAGSSSDTITISSISGNQGNNNTVTVTPTYNEAGTAYNYNFMGWMYITGFSQNPKSDHDGWNTTGWDIDSGALTFTKANTSRESGWGSTIHAMIAAIWNIGIRAS